MTTKIKWRLANRPTPHEVQDLYQAGLLTKDESREILFSLESDEDRDKKSLEDEIKFLRDLVQRLASSPAQIISTIKYVETPYVRQQWLQPYVTWCANYSDAVSQSQLGYGTGSTVISQSSLNTSASNSTDGLVYSYTSTTPTADFSEIKTF